MSLAREEQDTLTEVFGKILSERIRQKELLDSGVIPVDLFERMRPPATKLVFLTEELGEVARAVRNAVLHSPGSHRYDPHPENLETELIQLATHVCTWRASLIGGE